MGAADIVPGVSGGTIAFITGIYERLLKAISQIPKSIKSVIQTRTTQNVKFQLNQIDWSLFIPLGLGIVIAFLSLSTIITSLLDNHPGQTFAFFTGLILASAFVLFRHAKTRKPKHVLYSILAFILTYVLVGLTSTTLPSTLPIIFISGIIAICAMLLPGISGSYLLVILGQYQTIILAIHEKNFTIITIFSLGAIIGLLSIGRLLHNLFKKHHDIMIYILTGVMLGALRVPIFNITKTNISFSSMLFYIIFGAAIVIVLNILNLNKIVHNKTN